MTDPTPLEKLADHRDALLLAEVGAWLHDMGKSTDIFINEKDAQGFQCKNTVNPHKAFFSPCELNSYSFSEERLPERLCEASHYTALGKTLSENVKKSLNTLSVTLSTEQCLSISELIYFSRPGMVGKTKKPLKKNLSYTLCDFLGQCHASAHIEKEESDQSGKQPRLSTFASSPFGYEPHTPISGLTNLLRGLPYDKIQDITQNRPEFRQAVKSAFSQALGDTRRPANEVTLWDWSHIVAALFKSALAGELLKGTDVNQLPDPKALKWRLLSIRLDGWAFAMTMPGIQAVLTKKQWLDQQFDKISKLLEYSYPLGTEVYRDIHSLIFVVPDIENLLEFKHDNGKKLKITLNEVFEGEINPKIELSDAWHAQDPYRKGNDQLPPIGKILKLNPPESGPTHETLIKWWNDKQNTPRCKLSLRPSGKNIKNGISTFWDDQMRGRAKSWLNGLSGSTSDTIWISEVSDCNGRVALISGEFDLKNWLSDDGYVGSLLANEPKKEVKNASFARIHRIWTTCQQQFWQSLIDSRFNGTLPKVGGRIVIKGQTSKDLIVGAAYEIKIKSIAIEVVWDGEKLVVIAGQDYLMERFDIKSTDKKAETELINRINSKDPLIIYNSDDGSEISTFTIKTITWDTTSYDPIIPILTDPGKFMVLVPADKVPEILKIIQTKYEVEFSKVKNRLPIHLNAIFFPRKHAIHAVMDAAHRMERQSKPKPYTITEISNANPIEICTHSCGQLGGYVKKIKLTHCPSSEAKTDEATIKKSFETLVSYSTADPNVKDVWYPYFFTKKLADRDQQNPNDPLKLTFEAPLPQSGNKKTLVHVSQLKQGDVVYYTPSTVDMIYLDTVSRRYGIAYNEYGKRTCVGPLVLEDWPKVDQLWTILSGLTASQIKLMAAEIEGKRTEWQTQDQTTFSTFVEYVLKRSFGKKWGFLQKADQDFVHEWVKSGQWLIVLELYMTILKKRPNAEPKGDAQCK